MPERLGAVTGAPPAAVIAVLAARPLALPPRRVGTLTRWQAFATLWRQQWQPPAREERGQRWFAAGFSAALHMLFAVLLVWVAYVRFMAPPPTAGESVVQVEFIGRGTPEETGGGAPSGVQAEPVAAAASASAAPVRPTAAARPEPAATPAIDAAVPPVAVREIPEPTPAPPAAQPLQVTEVPAPDTAFTLPPPRRELPQPAVAVPEIRQPTREVSVVDVPAPVAPVRRELPAREIAAPELVQRVPDVETRAVPAPLPRLSSPAIAARPKTAPNVSAALPEVGIREVPMPAAVDRAASAPGAAASTTPSPTSAASSAQTGTAPAAAGRPAASSGTQPRATAAGSGAAPAARPGASPTPAKADDWGASTRTRPGGAPGGRAGDRPGLFNADGTPRLGEPAASPSPGAAPGTVEQRIADLDRAGTWLKRPPYDYTPTAFDKYWRPNETLLAEWVRRSIKRVSIPIPGTSKKIVCDVVLLAVGGGCAISDPNLNEQPATARPPPDIPFKPELQEDNGSVRPVP